MISILTTVLILSLSRSPYLWKIGVSPRDGDAWLIERRNILFQLCQRELTKRGVVMCPVTIQPSHNKINRGEETISVTRYL
jgi:hypothetical protein